jgi:hypothetical protein
MAKKCMGEYKIPTKKHGSISKRRTKTTQKSGGRRTFYWTAKIWWGFGEDGG